MSDFTIYTQASSGAPTLSGQNGALVAILDYFLPLEGWTVDYTSGFVRFYRRPAGGALLYVNDDSSVSGVTTFAVVRGAESRSGGTPVDPFPTVALVSNANSNWIKSNSASSAARDYRLYISPTMVRFYSFFTGTTVSDVGMFGDLEGVASGDSYPTICHVRNTSSTSTISVLNSSSSVAGAGKVWFARDISGAIKSSMGGFYSSSTVQLGTVPGCPAAGAGWANAIEREKIGVSCLGSTTTTTGSTSRIKRGWIPNLWNPLHLNIAAYTSNDTHGDTTYNAGAVFRVMRMGTTSNSTDCVIEEETDTWSPPSG